MPTMIATTPYSVKQINVKRIVTFTLILFCCVLSASIISLTMGDFELSLTRVIHLLWQPSEGIHEFVVWDLRLPRIITGLLAGAALGMAGAIVQSITRNPLGSPSLMGVSSGAACAIVLSLILFEFSTPKLMLCGTLGGFLAALMTFAIAWKTHLNPIHLTLAGMSISLFFSAAITVLLFSTNTDANGIYYWLAGSLANRNWQHVSQLYPYVLLGLGLGMSFARPLDLLMLDDMSCRSLGVAVHRWRLVLGLIAVILTATTVAVTGPIAFIGLISPHIVRFCLSSKANDNNPAINNHRLLLPLSALTGATLIVCADILARFQEVPVGILCILLGGPLFVCLVYRKES